MFFKSPVFLFTILQIQRVATFVYLRKSQTDLYHIACELWGKVLSGVMGKILPTHVGMTRVEFHMHKWERDLVLNLTTFFLYSTAG